MRQKCDSDWSHTIYLQVSATESNWFSSTGENQNWYISLVDACISRIGIACAVFSSYNDWVTLFGDANWSYQVN